MLVIITDYIKKYDNKKYVVPAINLIYGIMNKVMFIKKYDWLVTNLIEEKY